LAALPGAAGRAARSRWDQAAATRMDDWAASSGWVPSLDEVRVRTVT
jgi:hypothetical protein